MAVVVVSAAIEDDDFGGGAPATSSNGVSSSGGAKAVEEALWNDALKKALDEIRAKLGGGPGARRPLFDTDAVDLLQRVFAAPTWLVTGLITRSGIATIGAEPKAAKTWLGTEIAIAVATGTKVCGEFFAERGTVAYFYAEDLDKQVRNRVRALLAGRGAHARLARGKLHLQPRGEFLDLVRDEDLAWIVASCRKLGSIDLLVLDPLRDISSAAEDKSDEMSPVMRRLRLVAELLACTVAIVHHAGKSSADTAKRRPGQRLRGSGAIHGSTDSGIYLGDLDGDGSKSFTNVVDSEVKGARSAGRFTLALTIEDDEHGEAVSASWSVTRDEPKATKKQTEHDADDAAVLEFVRALAMRGECMSRRGLREHDERPIPEKRCREALDRLLDVRRLVLVGSEVRVPEPRPLEGAS